MDRPHLAAEPLQREHRRGIADMAVGDMGLDREDIHVDMRHVCMVIPGRRAAANPESDNLAARSAA